MMNLVELNVAILKPPKDMLRSIFCFLYIELLLFIIF